MEKKILIAIVALLACFAISKADVKINEGNFPDTGFRYWVLANVEGAGDGVLTDAEILSVTSLSITSTSGPGITNIQGVEFFSELKSLKVFNSGGNWTWINAIDVSKNKKLESLSLSGGESSYGAPTKITHLNVAGLPNLKTMNVKNPAFSELDCSGCSNLETVEVADGDISSFNFDGCVSLDTLNCSGNKIEVLDLTSLKSLKSLDCSNNLLASLEISGMKNLTCLNIANNNITSLTLDGCDLLPSLDCSNNLLTTLNIANCKNLASLNCANNKLDSLTFENLPMLKTLDCQQNLLSQLRVANCAQMSSIVCEGNQLKDLDVKNLPALQSVNCNNNLLENLDFLMKVLSVVDLSCSDNPFTTFDCSMSQLTSITFDHCVSMTSFPALPEGIKSISCSQSPIIAKADLSLYPNLTKLYADKCSLKDFDASKCPNVRALHLDDNNIMGLDLTSMTHLSTDLKISQWINMPAVKVKDQAVWEITMPATFDHTRVLSCAGNYLYGSGTRGDPGTETHVSTTTFTDANGLTRFSFLTSNITGDSSNGKGAFLYRYKVNPAGKISLVQVYGHEVSSDVEDVSATKVVSDVRYYDLQGHESAQPFNGFNIEVTNYTDGTSASKKFMK